MSNQLWTLRVKLLRYSGVSAVAVVVTQTCLWFGLVVTKWPAVVANVVAVSLGAIPAYLLNRSWVWGRKDSHSVRDEILPFWLYNLAGLAVSSTLVALADLWWASTALVMSANLAAFAVLWLGKFFILEKVLFKRS
ncbi:MAG: GtrA family protein [Acidimicrobiales bacterium]|jgi:putative flippase GtrA|nr:GtrA family protein [Acidimicrobiales bacterium]HJL99557.1 GtrA family protein [Acidimicrobiales bacterium]